MLTFTCPKITTVNGWFIVINRRKNGRFGPDISTYTYIFYNIRDKMTLIAGSRQ